MDTVDIKFINHYSFVYSDDDLLSYHTNVKPIMKENQNGKEIVFSEIHLEYMNSKSTEIAKNSKVLLEFYDASRISYYTFKQKDITWFNKKCVFNKIYNSICNVKKLKIKSSAMRNVRKGLENSRLQFYSDYDYQDLCNGFNLVKYTDYFKGKLPNIHDRVEFYLKYKEHVVSSIVKDGDIVVGIMIGLKIKDVTFMIEHLYNHEYNKYYINDALYYLFIKNGINKGSKLINLGTISLDDTGLLRMKKKYSTQIETAYILSYHNVLTNIT